MSVSRRNFIKQSAKVSAVLYATALGFSDKSYTNIIGASDRVRLDAVGFSDRFRQSLFRSFLNYYKEWKTTAQH